MSGPDFWARVPDWIVFVVQAAMVLGVVGFTVLVVLGGLGIGL